MANSKKVCNMENEICLVTLLFPFRIIIKIVAVIATVTIVMVVIGIVIAIGTIIVPIVIVVITVVERGITKIWIVFKYFCNLSHV